MRFYLKGKKDSIVDSLLLLDSKLFWLIKRLVCTQKKARSIFLIRDLERVVEKIEREES